MSKADRATTGHAASAHVRVEEGPGGGQSSKLHESMRDLAAWIVLQSTKAGADQCCVWLKRSRSVETTQNSLKEAVVHSVCVDLYVAGRYASHSTSDLRRDSLRQFLSDAVAITRLLDKDPLRTLPDLRCCSGMARDDLRVLDSEYQSLTSRTRLEALNTTEHACLERGRRRSLAFSGRSSDGVTSRMVMASSGFEAWHESTLFTYTSDFIVMDDDGARRTGSFMGKATHRAKLPTPARAGEMAADAALARLGAKRCKTETLPVMIRNSRAGEMLRWLAQPMTGINVQKKDSWLADRRGQRIASDKLTIIDDPLLRGGIESRPFDFDAMACRRRTMVEDGVLRDFYLGWYYARKLGMEPTTRTATNLIVPPGTRTPQQILEDLGRCLVVTDLVGGNSNATTGDFSVGVAGILYEKGEPVQAVMEMNIAGSNQQLWTRLVEVANDPWTYSSERTPSLLFDAVVVSGA